MAKPTSYREQDACANCKHVFVMHEYDCGSTHYCTHGAPTRPRCGSSSMDESFGVNDISSEQHDVCFDQDMDAWDAWSKDREVEPHGTCEHYQRKETTPDERPAPSDETNPGPREDR